MIDLTHATLNSIKRLEQITGAIRAMKKEDSIVRHRFSPRHSVSIDASQGGLTKQCFKDECDINTITKKWSKTGLVSHLNAHQGEYLDCIGADDYQTALNCLIKADDSFNSLPSEMRARFHNSPAEFLDFASNADNFDEMVTMGLANPKPVPSDDASAPNNPSVPPTI